MGFDFKGSVGPPGAPGAGNYDLVFTNGAGHSGVLWGDWAALCAFLATIPVGAPHSITFTDPLFAIPLVGMPVGGWNVRQGCAWQQPSQATGQVHVVVPDGVIIDNLTSVEHGLYVEFQPTTAPGCLTFSESPTVSIFGAQQSGAVANTGTQAMIVTPGGGHYQVIVDAEGSGNRGIASTAPWVQMSGDGLDVIVSNEYLCGPRSGLPAGWLAGAGAAWLRITDDSSLMAPVPGWSGPAPMKSSILALAEITWAPGSSSPFGNQRASDVEVAALILAANGDCTVTVDDTSAGGNCVWTQTVDLNGARLIGKNVGTVIETQGVGSLRNPSLLQDVRITTHDAANPALVFNKATDWTCRWEGNAGVQKQAGAIEPLHSQLGAGKKLTLMIDQTSNPLDTSLDPGGNAVIVETASTLLLWVTRATGFAGWTILGRIAGVGGATLDIAYDTSVPQSVLAQGGWVGAINFFPNFEPARLVSASAAAIYALAGAPAAGADGSVERPYPTISAAMAAVPVNGTTILACGFFAENVVWNDTFDAVGLVGIGGYEVTQVNAPNGSPAISMVGGAASPVRSASIRGVSRFNFNGGSCLRVDGSATAGGAYLSGNGLSLDESTSNNNSAPGAYSLDVFCVSNVRSGREESFGGPPGACVRIVNAAFAADGSGFQEVDIDQDFTLPLPSNSISLCPLLYANNLGKLILRNCALCVLLSTIPAVVDASGLTSQNVGGLGGPGVRGVFIAVNCGFGSPFGALFGPSAFALHVPVVPANPMIVLPYSFVGCVFWSTVAVTSATPSNEVVDCHGATFENTSPGAISAGDKVTLDLRGSTFAKSAAAIAGSGMYWPSGLQATWYIDPSNASALASDTNDGTTAATPVKTFNEIYSRWGGLSAVLFQDTTINVMSDQPDFTDPIVLDKITVAPALGAGLLTLKGALIQVGSGSFAAVTAKNRATGQRWTVTDPGANWTTHLYALVHDTTADCWFFVDQDIGVGQGRATQPMRAGSPSVITPAFGVPAALDAYIAYRFPRVFLASFGPTCTSGTDAVLWHLQVTGPAAPGPTPASTLLGSPQIIECRVDNFIATGPATNFFSTNSLFVGGLFLCGGTIVGGGVISQLDIGDGGQVVLDGDASLDINIGVNLQGNVVIGCAYTDVPLDVPDVQNNGGGRCSLLLGAVYYDVGLWGPGALNVHPGGDLMVGAGTLFAAALLQTGGFTLDGAATAAAWDPTTGVFLPGLALTPAHLDAPLPLGFGGLAVGNKWTRIRTVA